MEGKVVVWPLTARDHHGSLRERPVGLREIFEGEIAAIAGVHIKHSETRAFPGQDAYVGVWPCRPPLANLGRVDARGVQPVDDTGMLSWGVTLRIAARARPLGDIMERAHAPATGSVIESCGQKLLNGWRRHHSRPSCAVGRGLGSQRNQRPHWPQTMR